jgi:hypothetical protein
MPLRLPLLADWCRGVLATAIGVETSGRGHRRQLRVAYKLDRRSFGRRLVGSKPNQRTWRLPRLEADNGQVKIGNKVRCRRIADVADQGLGRFNW